MQRHFDLYGEMLKDESSKKLFDLVIITAINSRQKECYEHQLALKRSRNHLPRSIEFRVVSDPDEHKLGSGGSTMHALVALSKLSPQLCVVNKRILLIHAGGYSQRAPACSVLGKLFSPLPSRHWAIEDMLDLKLANYLPFALDGQMPPGVLLSCSDEFESFEFDEQCRAGSQFGGRANQIVLIAHKSSLSVAKDHGVYVLDNNIGLESSDGKKTYIYKCKQVLQKPSIERMKNLGIVLTESGSEYVYTDSVFYFTHKITQNLLEFYKKHSKTILDNGIEVDAYRDFLQPLGTEPLSLETYLQGQPLKSHTILTDIYKMFQGQQCLVFALKDSEFFHFGTVNELFDLYLNKNASLSVKFRNCLDYTNRKNSHLENSSAISNDSCIINSRLGKQTSIKDGSILEYCLVGDQTQLEVGLNCFVSNCWVNESDELRIPDNVCMHTVSVKIDGELRYATIFFDRRDDLKRVYSSLDEVRFLAKCLPLKVAELVKHNGTQSNCIWQLKIFRVYQTMSQSFRRSLEFVEAYLNENVHMDSSTTFYSLFDFLQYRCYENMLSFRQDNKLI